MAVNDRVNIIHGSATIAVGGVDMGWTQGGVTVRKANTYLDVEADQVAGVIVKKRTSERMFCGTTLIESTLANILVAMSEATSQTAGSGDMVFGSSAPTTIEYTLVLVGKASHASNTERTYTFYRAVLADDVEHMVGARDAIGTFPVSFELLKDPDNGYNFGYFTDATPA